MNIEHPTLNTQLRTGDRIEQLRNQETKRPMKFYHEDRKEHREGQTEDPGKVFEFLVFFAVNRRALCLLLLNPPCRVVGGRVQLRVDRTIMQMKNATSIASGWFFGRCQRRRKNFTIFHHIFQSEGLEISGFTQKQRDISSEGRFNHRWTQMNTDDEQRSNQGTKPEERMNTEHPTFNAQLRTRETLVMAMLDWAGVGSMIRGRLKLESEFELKL